MRLIKFCGFLFLWLSGQALSAQTVIYSNSGTTYTNTDAVTTDTYGPVDISNCSSISFSISYNFSLPFTGIGNMESSDECPFGIPPCQGDPNDPQGGGCADCWDFLYVQFQIDGANVDTRLVGVPGSTNQSGTFTIGPICTQNAATAGFIVQTQTWAANESITFNNITITCWDASVASISANPNPVCSGQSFNLTATLNHPNDVSGTLWTGPGTIVSPTNLTTAVNNAPLGTNTYTLTSTDDNSCTLTETVDVTVNPGPTMDDPPNITVCGGDQVDVHFTSGTSPDYAWTNSNPAIGLGASGTGDISFVAATVASVTTATITVTPTENGCTGTSQTFTITVNPLPTVNQPNNVTVCAGLPVNVALSGSSGATFNWTNDNTAVGLGASGTGNISFTSAQVANQEVATITVTPVRNGCEGAPVTFTITVNPAPTVVDPPNQSVCAGAQVDVTFSGTGNPTFNWTNSNPAIGLGPIGSGDISFTAANVSSSTTGNIIVTPVAGGCTGPNQSFTINVKPLPSMNQPNNVVACSGESINVAFTGTLGATFSWTNDNTAIGLGASGNGNLNFIAAGVSSNQVATITVTPTLNGCAGTPAEFTITILAAPTVADPPDQTVCSGSAVTVQFTGTGNPVLNWTNSNTAIGLGASGTGNISFTAATVASPVTGNLTVVPTANGCTGAAQNFSITVTPAPTANQPADVTACAGATVAVTFTGSTGASFNWTNSNTTIGLAASGSGNLNFIAAGVSTQQVATITVTPVIGTCSGAPLTFTITIQPSPTVVDPPNVTSCSGAPVTVNFTGTNNPTFNWVNNNTAIGLAASGTGNISFTAAGIGTATVVVTPVGANGCTGPNQDFTIDVIGSPTVNQPPNVSVCSGNPVTVVFTGTPGATFSWTNNNTAIGLGASGTGDISFTAANVTMPTTATISVTPSLGGCSGTTQNFDITVTPLPTLNIQTVSCAADLLSYSVVLTTDGTTVTATAGTVNGSGGNYSVDGIPAGVNVTISSTNTATGCQTQQVVNAPNCNCVAVNPPTLPNNPVICEGDTLPVLRVSVDSTATVDWYASPTGGTALHTGDTSYTITGSLAAGVYQYYAEARDTATDCVSSIRTLVTLTVNARPVADQLTDQSVCAGAMVSADFTGTASATFSWTNDNTGTGLAASGNGNISFTATNSGSTPLVSHIVVTPALNGCTGPTMSFNITVNPIPSVTPPANQTVCGGGAVSVTFNGNAGAIFNWTNSDPSIGLSASGSGNISFTAASVTNPTLANLTVTPSLAGCTGATENFSITVNPSPTVNPPANASGCAGAPVSVAFSGTAGASFAWTNSNTAIGLTASGNGNINFTGVNSGTTPLVATVTVTPSLNGCTGTPQTFTITINPLPTLTVLNTTCAGNLLTYSMNVSSNANQLTASAGTVSGSTPNFAVTNIPNGVSVVLTAQNTTTGCSQQQAVSAPNCTCPPVNPPNGPNFPVICEGTATPALTVNVPAGFTADWYSAPTGGTLLASGTTSFTPTGPFAPGTYIFYAETRDPLTGCVSATRTPVFLTVNATPTLTQPTDQSVCAGFVISIGFSGTTGATFNWTNSNPAIGLAASGTGNISFTSVNPGLTPVQATVTVTPSLFGCFGTPRTFTITVNPGATMTDPADVSVCLGSPVSVNFTGSTGSTFSWTNNNTAIGLAATGTGNVSFTAAATGSATLIVIPTANGCAGAPQTFTITVLNNPTMTAPTNQTVCAGASKTINFSGGAGFTYAWTNNNTAIGLPASGSGNITFTAANVSTVQTAQISVVPTSGSCSGAPQTFTITVNPLPAAAIAGAGSICSGDMVTLTASGGTTFSWSSGHATAMVTVTPSLTTTYTVTVTANGCTATATKTVTVKQNSAATVSLLTCDPAQVGTKTSTIMNAAGCDSVITTITTLDVAGCTPAVNLSNSAVSCFGGVNGIMTIQAGGGLAPYSYNWSNGAQTGSGQIPAAGGSVQVTDLTAGLYTVTVTGANGLSSTAGVQIISPPQLNAQATTVLSFGAFALSCEGATDATINGAGFGGSGNYQFQWSVPGQTNATLTGVGVGDYTLTVTDANQCTATASASVTEPPPFTFDFQLTDAACGATSIVALLNPNGGTAPYTVSVDGVSTLGGLTPNLSSGQHVVEISDVYGCRATGQIDVSLPPAPTIALPSDETVSLGETLVVEATTNLTVWQDITWTPVADTSCLQCLRQEWQPGISQEYHVAITDTFGCTATASIRVLVEKTIDLYVPNVFSPNLDGVNDFWQIFAGPSVVALNSLQIFDRWGDMVYFWDDPVPVDQWPGWDGKYRGERVNPAVFVYYLEVKLASGETVVKKGDLTVVR